MSIICFPEDRAARGAATSTVEALILSFREHGIEAFHRLHNDIRLAELSTQQIEEIVVRLNAQRHRNPKITDQLLARLIEIGGLA